MTQCDEEVRRAVLRGRPCDHRLRSATTTLVVTYHRPTSLWHACCTRCRRMVEPCLTRAEAIARAEKGWWLE